MNLSVYKSQIIIGLLTLLSFVTVAQKPISINEKITIEGQVLDENTKEGIPFSIIKIKDRQYKDSIIQEVKSDSLGNFSFEIDTGKVLIIQAYSNIRVERCLFLDAIKYFHSDKQLIETNNSPSKSIIFYLKQGCHSFREIPNLLVVKNYSSTLSDEDKSRLRYLIEAIKYRPEVKINLELRKRNLDIPIDSIKNKAIKTLDYLESLGLIKDRFIIADTLSYHKLGCYDLPYSETDSSILKEGVILTNEILNQLSEEEIKLVERYLDGIFFTVYSK
jgi:hypothetical protein